MRERERGKRGERKTEFEKEGWLEREKKEREKEGEREG